MTFPVQDTAGAWVPHGRFMLTGQPSGPLLGLRFAAKDVFDVAGHPTGAGNPTWLATHALPQKHSALVEQLLEKGATLVGKVMTDELAYSLHGDNIHYGTPLNARAPDSVTGGSSSGSAAAVAAKLVDFALGTDTGGSTRVPASYCGVWGLRTSHGLVSTEGLVPLHPSFDTATWLAHDASSFERVSSVVLTQSNLAPQRVLRLEDAWALADNEFQAPLEQVLRRLCDILNVAPEKVTAGNDGDGSLEDWRKTYATVGAHEGWKIHGTWIKEHQPTFSPAIQSRWMAASQISDGAAESARIQAARIRHRVRSLIGSNGIAVLPSAASLAPKRNADPSIVDSLRLRTMSITCIAGLAGLPQVSIPLATTAGQPLGISLLGPAGSDLDLIRLAIKLHQVLSE
jgi:amidase